MIRKIKWWITVDRIGPDIPLTHFLLHSSRLGYWLCRKKFATFGPGSAMRYGSYAVGTKHIKIGSNVAIRPSTMFFAVPDESDNIYITIGDNVLIGAGVHVYVSNHAFEDTSKPIYQQGHSQIKPVTLHDECWVGANAIILPGVTVGKHAVVGAGSVVTSNVPDYTVVAGNPARIIKNLNSDKTQRHV